MAGRRFAKLGKVRLALLLAGGLSTALTTLAPAPAGAATSLAGSGEEHHEWSSNPPTNQNFGGGTAGSTAPCVEYKHSTGRAVMTSGNFDVVTSGGTVSHPASNTNPIIVTIEIVNGGTGDRHFEGPDGTYKFFAAPSPANPLDFTGGCTNISSNLVGGDVIATDPSTTPAPTVTQGTSSTNLCSSATAVSIERDTNSSGNNSQTRRYKFTCKDSSVASATTYTLTATGLVVAGTPVDPVCNPPLASLDCVLSKATLT